MLAIGRCLMGAPELVMFDEPSLGLAPTIVQDVLRGDPRLNREGLTCVLVEQNVAVSLRLASPAYVLENGRVTLAGSGERVLADDRVRRHIWGCDACRSGRPLTRCASATRYGEPESWTTKCAEARRLRVMDSGLRPAAAPE